MNFPFPEIRDLFHQEPYQTTTKVHRFVHCEEEDSSGEVIVSHVLVPVHPSSLKEVELVDSKAGHQVDSVWIRGF